MEGDCVETLGTLSIDLSNISPGFEEVAGEESAP